jgi:AraC family transcriptional regulator
MSDRGAYGKKLAEAFHIEAAPAFVTRSLRKVEIAVTQIICGAGNNELTAPVKPEEGFLATVQVRDWIRRVLWQDDRPVRADPLKAGTLSIFDLRSTWVGQRLAPFHAVSFYLPRRSLDTIADLEDVPRVGDFAHNPGVGVADPTVLALASSLLPAFERPQEANALFVDHVTTAVAIYILRTYAAGGAAPAPIDRPLARWQEDRAKELLNTGLDGGVSISELARECGLPPAAFAQAFKRSVGMTPHRWLLEQRVSKAMTLLGRGDLSLADVAIACGFVDERHLTRVFTRRVGVAPAAWKGAVRH